MNITHPPYELLILVCTNARGPDRDSCARAGSADLHLELKRRVRDLNLPMRVRVSASGCLDLCAHGPVVLAYPGGRLYTAVRLEDIDTILADLFGPERLHPPQA